MLYVSNRLSYKSRTDLNMYKKDQLESTFIETILKRATLLLAVSINIPIWMC